MSVSQLRKQPTNRFPAATTKVDASDLPFPHGYLVPRRTAGIAAGALRRRPRPSDEVGRTLCKSEPWTWKRFPGMLTHRLRKLQNTLATGPAQRQPETRFASFFQEPLWEVFRQKPLVAKVRADISAAVKGLLEGHAWRPEMRAKLGAVRLPCIGLGSSARVGHQTGKGQIFVASNKGFSLSFFRDYSRCPKCLQLEDLCENAQALGDHAIHVSHNCFNVSGMYHTLVVGLLANSRLNLLVLANPIAPQGRRPRRP